MGRGGPPKMMENLASGERSAAVTEPRPPGSGCWGNECFSAERFAGAPAFFNIAFAGHFRPWLLRAGAHLTGRGKSRLFAIATACSRGRLGRIGVLSNRSRDRAIFFDFRHGLLGGRIRPSITQIGGLA